METVNVLALMIAGISGPCTTVSIEEVGVVSTVYTLRQLALPADEPCMQIIAYLAA